MSKELDTIGNFEINYVFTIKDEHGIVKEIKCKQIKDMFPKEFEIIEKKLKVLEMIKEKKVNVKCIMSGWTLNKYNSYNSHMPLTQEEFDLLKEVLK